MRSFLDRWAFVHRNCTAAAAAVFITGILLWGIWVKMGVESRSPVATSYEEAVVKKVIKVENPLPSRFGPTDTVSYQAVVELSDGSEATIALLPPIPRAGERVPVVVVTYNDGRRYCRIDRVKWQTGESIH